jgi:homoserine dehydrogenase
LDAAFKLLICLKLQGITKKIEDVELKTIRNCESGWKQIASYQNGFLKVKPEKITENDPLFGIDGS